MKTNFWLLDINYELVGDSPEIRLWGIDEKGNRVLILDRNFQSYFYLLPNEDADPSKIVEEIKSSPEILSSETVDKKYFGKPVKVIKITCKNPDLTVKYAKEFVKISGIKSAAEDDLRYSSQYMLDNGISPCGWQEIEVEEIKKLPNITVDKVYLAKTASKILDRTELPKLRILGFSTVYYSETGSPKPNKDPIIIISAVTSDGAEKQFITKNSDDKMTLAAFIKFLNDFDPDIIVGYGNNTNDWPYIMERSKKLNLPLKIDRSGTEPHTSLYGHISVTGRANVDLYDFVEDITEVKVKTLDNIASFFNVKKEEKIAIEDVDIPTYWKDERKRQKLVRFSAENAGSIIDISKETLDFAIQLSNLVGLPLDYVGAAAVGFRVEWYIIRQTHKLGELAPKRIERPYFPYVGAIVLEPKQGLHDEVAVLDFKSMYPSIMIVNNISPDTFVSKDEPTPSSGVNVAPEIGYKFRKEPPGFYKQVLSSLITARDNMRKKMKTISPKNPEYRILNARQKAVKVITNACYGYTGWIGARWYIKPVAESAAAWGRATILSTIELAEKLGLEVIYGDTDSIFVKNIPNKIEEISKQIGEKMGLEIKPDKVYTRILFTEAKKRYAGLLRDGSLDIVGLEVVRGDWAAVAKKVQEKVLEIILKEKSPEKASEYVRQQISLLNNKKIPYSDMIIWKTLTKSVNEYKVRAPHVEAAKLLTKAGLNLTMGDKVGYVIIKGPGKLYNKAKPYMMTTYEEIDIDYYVSNQILPAVLRILEMFGVTQEQLLQKDTNSLLEYTGSK